MRQLRAFTVIYETGNVSAAADILALTQPAITVLLRELEFKLGVRLFERGPRGLQRTEAAVEAMRYVKRVFGDLHDMRTNMQAIASGTRGMLRIAATATVAQTMMPRLLKRFMHSHPFVRVSVDDCGPHEFAERIATQRVHLGVGALEAAIPGLQETVFQQDWLHAVAHSDLLSNNGKTITWKQLEGLPIIVVKPGYGIRRSIDLAAAKANSQLNLVHEVSLMSTAVAMANEGLGIALVPGSLAPDSKKSQLRAHRIIRPLVPRNLAIVCKSNHQLTPSAQAFADMLLNTTGFPP